VGLGAGGAGAQGQKPVLFRGGPLGAARERGVCCSHVVPSLTPVCTFSASQYWRELKAELCHAAACS